MEEKQEKVYLEMIKQLQNEIKEKDAFIEELLKKAELYDLYAEKTIHAENYINALNEAKDLQMKIKNELKEIQKFKAEFVQKVSEIL